MKNRTGNNLVTSGISSLVVTVSFLGYNWIIITALIISLAVGVVRYRQGRISLLELMIPIIMSITIATIGIIIMASYS